MSRVFIAIFPAGISYADRLTQTNGDYKPLAFLPFKSLELEVQKDCPAALLEDIKPHVAAIQARKGQPFQVSTCGQTITLGK